MFIFTFSIVLANESNIGILNYHKIFINVPQGKTLLDNLHNSLLPKIKNLKDNQKDLIQIIKNFEYNTQNNKLSKSDSDSAIKIINDKKLLFENNLLDLRNNEYYQEKYIEHTFNKSLINSINNITKDKHYNIILFSQALPYFDTTFDISENIIHNMNINNK